MSHQRRKGSTIMMKLSQIIDRYNELTEQLGEPAIKEWKGKRVDLENEIEALELRVKAKQATAKKAEKIEPAKKTEPATEKTLISVAELARELQIDPKLARAKLRRKGYKSSEGHWPVMERGGKLFNEIKGILKPANENQVAPSKAA